MLLYCAWVSRRSTGLLLPGCFCRFGLLDRRDCGEVIDPRGHDGLVGGSGFDALTAGVRDALGGLQ